MLAVRDADDRAAFARLFDFYAPRVKAMAMRGGTPAGGGRGHRAGRDAAGLAVARRSSIPSRAQVSGWIYQIARNRRIDLARRAPRPLPEDVAAQPAAAGSRATRWRSSRRWRGCAGRFGRCRRAQREMVEQAYLGELTHREISRQTSLPLGTVKSRLRLALERLRHELRGLRK